MQSRGKSKKKEREKTRPFKNTANQLEALILD